MTTNLFVIIAATFWIGFFFGRITIETPEKEKE